MKLRMLLLLLLITLSGCVAGPSGTVYRKAEPEGEEYLMTGVVIGLYKYDPRENKERLEEYLPRDKSDEANKLSTLYQVKVRMRYIPGIYYLASEIVLLPNGWAYTSSDVPETAPIVNLAGC